MATTGWYRVDPLISMGIGLIILVGAWRLLREVVHVLLEATPRGLDPGQVARAITEIPGVHSVHYPGLGCVLSFETGSVERSQAIVDATSLFSTSVSFGCVASSIRSRSKRPGCMGMDCVEIAAVTHTGWAFKACLKCAYAISSMCRQSLA